MPTKAKAWPEKLHFPNLLSSHSHVTGSPRIFHKSNNKQSSITVISPLCKNMPEHQCMLYPNQHKLISISILTECPQTQYKLFPQFSESTTGSILFPISDYSSSILISAFTMKTPMGPSTAFSRLSQTPSWDWLQDTTLAQKESSNNSFWFV